MPGRVAARTRALAAMTSPLPVMIQKLYLDLSPYRALLCASQGAERCIAACIVAPITTQRPPPKPRYKPLYCDLPLVRPCLRALCRMPRAQVGRVVGRVVASSDRIAGVLGRVMVVSWLAMHAPMRLCPAMSRYSLLYRDQAWELGK